MDGRVNSQEDNNKVMKIKRWGFKVELMRKLNHTSTLIVRIN